MRPLTDDRPKALVEVAGETIVGRAIRLLVAHGVQKVVLATGYREDALRRACEGLPVAVVYCHNPSYETTQNAVSLALCRRAVGTASFFKLDGDLVFSSAVLERLEGISADLVAGVDCQRPLDEEAMKVRVEGDRIRAFGKALEVPSAYGESIGIERVDARASDALFDALEVAGAAGRLDLYYEDVYDLLIRGGWDAKAVDVSDLPWSEIDTPHDLAAAERLLGQS